MDSTNIQEILKRYRNAAEATSGQDPRKANKWQHKMHSCYKLLRSMEEGRMGIVSLLSNSNPHVRCWSAAHPLEWAPDAALATLEDLRDRGGPCSLDAKYTLREHAKGRLSFEY